MSNSRGLRSLAATASLVLGLSAAAAAQAPYFSRVDLAGAVQELDATDLNGRRWNIDALRGRIVLLEFWATWCAPCLDQIPLLRELRQRHGDRFEIVGVSLNSSSRRDLVAWLNRQDVGWPQIHDGRAFNAPIARAFGVRALPASLLLDADGTIAAANLRGERLRQTVDALVYRASTRSLDAARMPIVRR